MERLYKGNSLIRKLDDYTVLDIETTSLDTFSGEIVEISAIKNPTDFILVWMWSVGFLCFWKLLMSIPGSGYPQSAMGYRQNGG